MWMDEKSHEIAIYNNGGKIIVYSSKDIEFKSDGNIKMDAAGHISMKAGTVIKAQASGTKFTITKNIQTNTKILAEEVSAFFPGLAEGRGAGTPRPAGADADAIEVPEKPSVIEPTDRGKSYNQPFEECPKIEVQHPLK